MKKIILFGLIFLLSILSVNALSTDDTCSFGDADGNCLITNFDILLINNYFNGQDVNWYYGTPLTLDIDGDGTLTSLDKNILQKYINVQEFDFVGKPVEILVNIINPNFDLNNINVGDIYDLEVIVVDSDETPRPIIGVQFSSTPNIELSTNYATTDLDGKIHLTATTLASGDATFTAHINGDLNKGIDNIDFNFINININSIPSEILVDVVTPNFDLNNINVGDVYDLEVSVLDNDGLPKSNVDVTLVSTPNILLSLNSATTDIDGKIHLTATILSSSSNTGTLTAHTEWNSINGINSVDYDSGNININSIPVVEPTPITSSEGGGGGGGGGNHDYVNQEVVVPIKTPAPITPTPVIQPAENTENTNQNTPTAETQTTPIPTGAAIANLVKENPVAAVLVSLLVLGLIGGAIYYFKKK